MAGSAQPPAGRTGGRPGRPPDPGSGRRLAVRVLVGLALALPAVGLALALWGFLTLRASLPLAEGTRVLPGLAAPVTLTRDALGVPTLSAASRLDLARATGFLHAQERFFQMDLQRRKAAGELSALVGPAALPLDRAVRIHRFRMRAGQVLERARPDLRALVETYADGVNAGLAALKAPPFEYLLLRTAPEPWLPEDSVLTIHTMFLELQGDQWEQDRRRGLIRARLPASLADFLLALGSDWDTPLAGDPLPPPPVPGPQVADLRRAPFATHPVATVVPVPLSGLAAALAPGAADPDPVPGSNAWAVAGAHAASGAALLAGDMHLGHSVPNIWYRAVLVWGEGTPAGGTRLVGVTLPGVPALVAGSNGAVAWAFTNSEADAADRVALLPDPSDPNRYLAPGGPRAYGLAHEPIAVKGAPPEPFTVRETQWGPVLDDGGPGLGAAGPGHALSWVAHSPEAVNLELMDLERVQGIDEALAVAPRAGIPAQSMVVTDRTGRIAWTIAGRLPMRAGCDGQVPVSWADGTRGWSGWLDPADYPRLLDPPGGRILSANNRLVGGTALVRLGIANYDQGARARLIRDGLAAVDKATPADMLRLQLDDRADFLARWRDLARAVVSLPALPGAAGRPRAIPVLEAEREPGPEAERALLAEARKILETDWSGHAAVGSAAYRLVRAFREETADLAFAPLLAPVRALDPSIPPRPQRAMEGALWALVDERPAHLLDPAYPSWEALLGTALARAAAGLAEDGEPLAAHTWGEANRLAMRHPLSLAVPALAPWLDMPARPLPGDNHMPRVQAPGHGASQRLVVSPGREEEGLFHMPGGQSGHPLSPAYRAGHQAWAEGLPAPLLPGPAVSTLTLLPAQ